SLTFSWTAGMRVMPPTRTTWSTSLTPLSFASSRAWRTGATTRSSRSAVSSLNFERVRRTSRCLGPLWSAVMNGRLICDSCAVDSSILAFSAASYRRCSAIGSWVRSMPWSRLNSAASQSTTALSQLSPPRWLSPAVDLTSTTPSPIASTDTAHEALAGRRECDDRGGGTTTLGVLDRGRLAALEDGHARVRRAEVDADGLCHRVWGLLGSSGRNLSQSMADLSAPSSLRHDAHLPI